MNQFRSRTILSFFISFALMIPAVFAGVREPAVAGKFYPDDPKELTSYVDELLSKSYPMDYEGEPVAFLVPHAGYPYSGEVAARVYKIVADLKPQTIIFIGTAHHYPLKGASIFPKGSFKTPLGEVAIDSETAKKLIDRDKSLIDITELAHEKEHSIEVQLPFLQRTLPNVSIVPVIIGNAEFEAAIHLGSAVSEVVSENESIGRKTLVIASTDLSHYPKKSDAERSDLEILESLKSVDPKIFWEANQKLLSQNIPNLACAMCGDLAMAAVLQAAKALGASDATVLKYTNSANVPLGSAEKVVGYAAVRFAKPKPVSFDFSKSDLTALTDSEQNDLLKVARNALKEYLKAKNDGVKFQIKDSEKNAAVFVTLKKNGELRGCIGSPEPSAPIAEAVKKYAIAAASQDPRFAPVKASELSSITIEVSVLTPKQRIKTVDEIEPGRHGVVIESGTHRGLFLPQVWEMIPDKTQFLNALALEKAGLAEDAWKNPETNLYVFETKNFNEKEYFS